MSVAICDLKVKSLPGAGEGASVSILHAQSDGSFLVGFAFADKLVARFFPKTNELKFVDCDLGPDAFAVTGGLQQTLSGDTAFSVLHKGSLPSFLLGLGGGDPFKKSGPKLAEDILHAEGGMGFRLRHSVLMLSKDEVTWRHSMMPGALLDVTLIGDFLFGLDGASIWREHYLKPEKRETLRSDLNGNLKIARSDDGIIWLLSESGRLLRMEQTDIKAKPTPLKIPVGNIWNYASNAVDTWTYLVCGEGKTLVRVRRNSVTGEEEQQNFPAFDSRITSLCAVESEMDSKLYIALEGSTSTDAILCAIPLVRPEDPEFMQEIPEARFLKKIEGFKYIGTMSALKNDDRSEVWGGEGALGWGGHVHTSPRLVKLSGF